MPIHVNLLTESQLAEEMRRRDPVKRFIFFCVSLVAIALMFSALMGGRNLLAKERLSEVQQAIDAKTNAYQNARQGLLQVTEAKNKLAALDKLQAARFLQGNLLNALQHATVEGVQLTSLRLEQSYDVVHPEGKKGKPAPPPTSTERITLHLGAKDFSENPGDKVNTFKDTIASQPYFKALLQTNSVQLAGPPTRAQNNGGKPYVTFTLDCHFVSHTR